VKIREIRVKNNLIFSFIFNKLSNKKLNIMILAFFKKLFGFGNNDALKAVLAQRPFLVDVRTPEEFSTGSVTGAVNIPLGSIPANLSKFKDKKHIVVFCRSGMRSGQAKNILESNGYSNVVNGGTWNNVKQLLNS
jgi:phage shock protein E